MMFQILLMAVLAITTNSVQPEHSDPDDGPDGAKSPATIPTAQEKDMEGHEAPTAEELLRELRKQKPPNEVIAPAGGSAEWPTARENLLLPEGSGIVGRTGWLAEEGDWWTFVSQSADAAPPIKLLPNTNLEVMIRTAGGSSAGIAFVVSGEMTVFDNENYLLLRDVRRSLRPKSVDAIDGSAGVATKMSMADSGAMQTDSGADGRPDRATRSPGVNEAQRHGGETTSKTPRAPSDVEEVLASMRRQAPAEEVLPIPPLVRATLTQTTPQGRTLIPEGAPLIRRPGRLIQDGKWWSFSIESDSPQHPEPPIKLLPGSTLELMVHEAARESLGLIFLVSGEVTMFNGENYLLPRVATRRIDLGNLSR